MASPLQPAGSTANRVRIVVATSVMLTFISYWRAAAIVLNDLGSSAFYAAGIAEQAVGKSAPWFIVGVMLFSFAVRAVYVESCSMFVRGGVYRVVKEALGGTLAKISVSALMFDYILTGPISGVSAGQYIAGLINDTFATADAHGWVPRAMHVMFRGTPHVDVNWTSVVFAIAVTMYFWWQNTKGIQESSEKALRVMQITTVMVIILLGWSAFTLLKQGFQTVPLPTADSLKFSSEALGFMKHTDLAQDLARKFGILGILIAFGHSVLAMSGEESLAQVNRELAHPKLKNLKRAAIIIAVYSFVFTGLTALLFVMIIPDSVRIPIYKDNLIAGLAMYQYGPRAAETILPRLRRGRRLPDSLRRGQHRDHRLQRRAEPHLRRRRPHRLVPPAASPLRHHLPDRQPGRLPPAIHHSGQPRQRLSPRRSLRLRRDLEFHLQQPGHAGAAGQIQRRAGMESSAQHHHCEATRFLSAWLRSSWCCSPPPS